MKPTAKIQSFDELTEYRKRIQNPSYEKKHEKGKKPAPVYLLKNPLAPAAVFIGIAAVIFCIVTRLGFLPIYGSVCVALFGVMCAFMPAGRAFVSSFILFALYPAAEILIEVIKTGQIPYEDRIFLIEYLPLLILLGALYIIAGKLRGKIREKPVPSIFKTDSGVKFIDMIFADVKPIPGYSKLARAVCRIDPPQPPKVLSDSRAAVSKFALGAKLLLCASVIKTEPPQKVEHYLYLPQDFDAAELNKYFDKHFKDFEIEISEDPEWKTFRQDILPSDEELQLIYNEKMYELMSRKGLNHEQIRRICYVACFENADSAMEAVKAARENGFSVYTENNKPVNRQTAEDGSAVYVTALEMESSTGLEKLNANTSKVMSFIKAYGGYLHHWTLLRDGRGQSGTKN